MFHKIQLTLIFSRREGLLIHNSCAITRGCNNTICPEDEQGTARNMLRIIM